MLWSMMCVAALGLGLGFALLIATHLYRKPSATTVPVTSLPTYVGPNFRAP